MAYRTYKFYDTDIYYCDKVDLYVGRILDIKGTVEFFGETFEEAEDLFIAAVDAYIKWLEYDTDKALLQ